MDKFLYICAAVRYEAGMQFIGCMEQLKDPKIKKAMRLTVQKMLHAEIHEGRYSK